MTTPPGYYLYGIVRARASDGPSLVLPDVGRVELMREGRVSAVIRRVPLRDFAPETIEKRFRDKAWLESTVRAHDAVIEAIHRERALLPAKFGAVYARAEDIAAALRDEEERLVSALARVDGHDEWVVHLRVDEDQLAGQTAPQDDVDRRPGHAYFQQRRAERDRKQALESARNELASAGYEALARTADDGRVIPASAEPSGTGSEVEVLRASFLVKRGDADDFLASMSEFAAERAGTRWEYSGPLPPYRFAAAREEEAA